MLSKSLFSLVWKVRSVKIILLFELFITQIRVLKLLLEKHGSWIERKFKIITILSYVYADSIKV